MLNQSIASKKVKDVYKCFSNFSRWTQAKIILFNKVVLYDTSASNMIIIKVYHLPVLLASLTVVTDITNKVVLCKQ